MGSGYCRSLGWRLYLDADERTVKNRPNNNIIHDASGSH
jgi:hypothetical protein